jgi:hypothetical protein
MGRTFRGSNCGGGEIFSTRPDLTWGPPSLLYNGYWVSFPGVKRPGRNVNQPPASSSEVKESRTMPLHPLWSFMASSTANLTFTCSVFYSWLSVDLTFNIYVERSLWNLVVVNYYYVSKFHILGSTSYFF